MYYISPVVIWIYLILAAVDYSWYIYHWNYVSIQPSIQPHHTTLQPSVFGRGAFGFEAGQTFDLKVSFTWRVKASETSGSDVVKVMYTDSMWRGSMTLLLKEGTCYTAIDVMFTSLVTYHNLILTLPSNLSPSNYKFPWSFSLVFYIFWLLIHQSSEMTEDIGLGGSWFVFWEQDTPNSWRVTSFLKTPGFLGAGAVISRLENWPNCVNL